MWCALAGALAVTAAAGSASVVPLGALSELHVCSEGIFRVVHRPTADPLTKVSLIVADDWAPVEFSTHIAASGDVHVETARIVAVYSAEDGTVSFTDKSSGELVLREAGHSLTAIQDLGLGTFQVEQSWAVSADEGLYGGGEYQTGFLNFRNAPIQMIQYNTQAIVPFFWSTAGYGLLWDNYAWSFLNPPESALVPLSTTPSQGSVSFSPVADGDHFFYLGRPAPKQGETPLWNGGDNPDAFVRLADPSGRTIVVQDWQKAANFPQSMTGVARGLKKGVVYRVDYGWPMSNFGLYVQGPEYGKTKLWSAVGDAVDYYFVAAKSGDEAVAGYRTLTGAAPLYAKWVFGFWQCREHYATQAEVLEAAHGFRNRSIPVDAIVQDWHYWGNLGWGPQWDKTIYPDPAAMVSELHAMEMRLMVSVWAKFDEETSFYQEMSRKGWLLGGSNWYDAWNPSARDLYYNYSKAAHFSIGVDALWLDATEPENFPNSNTHTYAGTGNYLMNSYSLVTTQAIADGLRRDYPEAQGARVFSLTRSSFAGQQRTGAALWSGDTSSSWDVLRRQIVASINYQMSGIPYWSEDIGGFFRPSDQYTSSTYHDLLIRWFQFGAFTPLFRVHGAGSHTEIWNFGDDTATKINTSAISLRYRLLPYIYSGFARVELGSYTMQRGLAMDFKDAAVRSIDDQFMWGDAFMVTPIYTPVGTGSDSSTRRAYFPSGSSWVNFHTGQPQCAGEAQVTFKQSEAPVFVRSGNIVVMGPMMQHSRERRADPLEVRIYAGGDARFTLFEDDDLSRRYQRGERSFIEFSWNDASHKLTVGTRDGSFEGMLAERTFNVVLVRPGHGVGVEPSSVDVVVKYSGAAIVVPVPSVQTELVV